MIRFALSLTILSASASFAQAGDEPVPDRETETKAVVSSPANCDDTIHHARAAAGQPRLERGPATADEALMIAAVDLEIDGCAVMVMRQDTSDLRPLPAPSQDVRIVPLD